MQKTLTAALCALFSTVCLASEDESTLDETLERSPQVEAAVAYLNADKRWCEQFNRKCAGAIIDKTNQKLYLIADQDRDGTIEVFFETGILTGKQFGDDITQEDTTPAGVFPHVTAVYNEAVPTYNNGSVEYPYFSALHFADTLSVGLAIHGTLFPGDEENIQDGPENNRQSKGCIRVSVDEASREEINAFETVHRFFDPSSNNPPRPTTWDLAQAKQTSDNPYHAFHYAQIDTQMSVIVLPEENTSIEYTQQFLGQEITDKQHLDTMYKLDIK